MYRGKQQTRKIDLLQPFRMNSGSIWQTRVGKKVPLDPVSILGMNLFQVIATVECLSLLATLRSCFLHLVFIVYYVYCHSIHTNMLKTEFDSFLPRHETEGLCVFFLPLVLSFNETPKYMGTPTRRAGFGANKIC